MNMRPINAHGLGSVEFPTGVITEFARVLRQQRDAHIKQLREWQAQTKRRVQNFGAFRQRALAVVDRLRAELPPTGTRANPTVQQLLNAFADQGERAALAYRAQGDEIKRLESGGAVRNISALAPPSGLGDVIPTITLPKFGPASGIVDNARYDAFISGTPLPPPATAVTGAAYVPPTSKGPAAVADETTTAADTLQQSAPAPAAGPLDQLTASLQSLPTWTPFAIGGLALLLLATGGKRR